MARDFRRLTRRLAARLPRALRALTRETKGTAAIEFAIVAPATIAIALATLQAASIYLAKAYFESGAEAGARIVLTNQTGALTSASFKTAVCNELSILFDCSKVIVQLTPLPAGTTTPATLLPTFDTKGNLVGSPPVDVGPTAPAPGTDMLLVVMYQWPVFGGPLGLDFSNVGSGLMLMASTQVFRVEPN